MLEIRPSCENCDKPLPADSEEAMICTYECTFCQDCVNDILHNVCPNCGGGFEKRPIRPKGQLTKHPAATKKVYKPINEAEFEVLLKEKRNIPPKDR